MEFYVSRNSCGTPTHYDMIEVWPVEVGVQKERGCVVFAFPPTKNKLERKLLRWFEPMTISIDLCLTMFGFLPRGGEAYHVLVDGNKITADLLDEPYMDGKKLDWDQDKEPDEGSESARERKYYL